MFVGPGLQGRKRPAWRPSQPWRELGEAAAGVSRRAPLPWPRASADFETVKWIYLRKTGETAACQLHRGLRAGRGGTWAWGGAVLVPVVVIR